MNQEIELLMNLVKEMMGKDIQDIDIEEQQMLELQTGILCDHLTQESDLKGATHLVPVPLGILIRWLKSEVSKKEYKQAYNTLELIIRRFTLNGKIIPTK